MVQDCTPKPAPVQIKQNEYPGIYDNPEPFVDLYIDRE